jgi:hypothetical protein
MDNQGKHADQIKYSILIIQLGSIVILTAILFLKIIQ